MNGSSQIAESALYPGIRMLTVDTDTATTPLPDIRRVKYAGASSWLQSKPTSFGQADFSYPSAICYYFAKQIYMYGILYSLLLRSSRCSRLHCFLHVRMQFYFVLWARTYLTIGLQHE